MVDWECPYQSDLDKPYENVPIKMNGFNEKWVNWVKWGEMSDLKDLTWMNPMGISLWSEEGEPYESDLSEPNGNLPISWEWVSLSIWLDWSQWESPYVQLNECPYASDLSEPNGNGPMVEWKCPYASDLMWVKMSVPIKMNGIDEIWTRISEMKWNEWIEGFEGFDFVNPMRKSLWSEEGVPMRVTWVKVIWSNPIKMNGIDEKWMNWSE